MKNWPYFLSGILCFSLSVFAHEEFITDDAFDQEEFIDDDAFDQEDFISDAICSGEEVQARDLPSPEAHNSCQDPHGWSLELGGQYTWMSFTTPPTFTGSTGGVQGKLTYQESDAFFGQLRSVYNIGSLSSSLTTSSDKEWYTEFVAGYCICVLSRWTITPYLGVGLDLLKDHKKAYSTISGISLHYGTYYALFGFDTHYSWQDWYLGLQAECLPVFHQYLSIGGISSKQYWGLNNRVGAAVRIPIGYKLAKSIWLELTPYYRFLPIGGSSLMGLSGRGLNQVGAFLTFRFFL